MPFEYTIKHDPVNGYKDEKDPLVYVKRKDICDRIKSYIKSVTGYGDKIEYVDKGFETLSFADIGGFFTIVEGRMDFDGQRNFIFRKITLVNLKEESDFGFSKKMIKNKRDDNRFGAKTLAELKLALIMSASSEKSRTYILTDSDYIDFIRSVIASLTSPIIKRMSCIDVVGEMPTAKSDIYICRCFSMDDRNYYKEIAGNYTDSVCIELFEGELKCEDVINNPSYCAAALKVVAEEVGKEQAVAEYVSCSVSEPLKDVQQNSDFFNCVAYGLVKKKYSRFLSKVFASQQEIDGIENVLNSGR